MLDPHDRASLYEALRPPPGFDLDVAVGTSFTLDLEALLTAPIAFALHAAAEADVTDDDAEPVGLLEAIRRHADRITVFCQAGQIAVPRRRRSVFAWLEDAVVEVAPPNTGRLFHPKVWVARYRSQLDATTQLRVLCATRNLTFDTSWDTLLRLESEPYERPGVVPIDGQQPLAQLVRTLPELATHPPGPARRAAATSLADDLERVPLVPPPPFTAVTFHTFGVGEPTWPFPHSSRGLVVSPFVTAPLLTRLTDDNEVVGLVSREESLDRAGPGAVHHIEALRVLSAAIDVTPLETDASATDQVDEHTDPGRRLSGLHAKLFAFDTDDGPRWFTGSANATGPAFDGNVEVLAELAAPADAGVPTVDELLIGSADEHDFAAMLVEYRAPGEPSIPDTEELLDRALDRCRRRLSTIPLTASVTGGPDDYTLSVATPTPLPALELDDLEDVEVHLWPVTLDRESSAQPLVPLAPVDARFTVTLEGLSAFFGVRVTGRYAGRRGATTFLLCAPLTGAPHDRASRLLASLLADPTRLLRYLLMLLDDRMLDEFGAESGAGASWLGRWRRSDPGEVPLLELLLRSVQRDPGRLDHIDQLLRDLAERRVDVLPDGFDAVWGPIWEYREGLR